uniref:Uncharacterized protein n=1 Tax=Neobodo designis TaxID=312471 RepID=A0A7S1KX23_NEODS|mmetsp:Transcript_10257/g.31682  ORF Transcript_10257/g.31682 Transcript_10257/m.31682 type:complete len:539 (+) Transcript_10257:68-1684(+)
MDHEVSTRVLLPDAGVRSFIGLREVSRGNAVEIAMPGNEIWSFEGFGTNDKLRQLDIRNNRIASFLGMTKQVGLRELLVSGNPVAAHPHYRLMALLTIGFGLRMIDGIAVSREELAYAKALGPMAALAVSCGWLLDLHPRSDNEYDSIISELRSARREMLSKKGNTTPTLLEAFRHRHPHNTELTESVEEPVALSSDQGDTLHRKTIDHMARRITYLERKLSAVTRSALPPESLSRATPPPSDCRGGQHQAFNVLDSPLMTIEIRSIVTDSNIVLDGKRVVDRPVTVFASREQMALRTVLHKRGLWVRRWESITMQCDASRIRIASVDGTWVALPATDDTAQVVWNSLHVVARRDASRLGGSRFCTNTTPAQDLAGTKPCAPRSHLASAAVGSQTAVSSTWSQGVQTHPAALVETWVQTVDAVDGGRIHNEAQQQRIAERHAPGSHDTESPASCPAESSVQSVERSAEGEESRRSTAETTKTALEPELHRKLGTQGDTHHAKRGSSRADSHARSQHTTGRAGFRPSYALSDSSSEDDS